MSSIAASATGCLGPNAIGAVSFPVVGALIATHRPRNPIGWLFCAVGVLTGPAHRRGGVQRLRPAHRTRHATRRAAGALGCATGLGAQCWAAVHLRALAVPRRPAAVAPLAAGGLAVGLSIVLTCGLYATLLWPLRGVGEVEPEGLLTAGQTMVLNAAFPFMVLCGLACLGALAVRFRRARGIERQQLKWLLFAAAITLVIISVGELVSRLALLALFPAIPLAAGNRDPALPPVRHRSADQPHAGLWAAHCPARRRLCRRGPGPRPAVWRDRHRAAELGGRRRHPGRGGPVLTSPAPYPRQPLTGASIGENTTLPGPSRRSASGSAASSTSMRVN